MSNCSRRHSILTHYETGTCHTRLSIIVAVKATSARTRAARTRAARTGEILLRAKYDFAHARRNNSGFAQEIDAMSQRGVFWSARNVGGLREI